MLLKLKLLPPSSPLLKLPPLLKLNLLKLKPPPPPPPLLKLPLQLKLTPKHSWTMENVQWRRTAVARRKRTQPQQRLNL